MDPGRVAGPAIRVFRGHRVLGALVLAIGLGPSAASAPTVGQLWLARYNGPADRADSAYALGVSPDGTRVYVTGRSPGSGTSVDYATVAYNAAIGAQLWVARYIGPGDGYDEAAALAVHPDGTRVYVTGYSFGSGTDDDYATVAYNAATGAQLWVARYNGPAGGYDAAKAIGVSSDGATLYVTGSSDGSGTGYDYATVAYDAATGARKWVARYNGPPGNLYDEAAALGVSHDGARVYVTGYSFGTFYPDHATVAYDATNGAQLWVARYNGPADSDDYGTALGVSPDGTRVHVTGYSYADDTDYDYATLTYNAATGAQQWVARYNGPGGILRADYTTALAVSPDGVRVYVTGRSYGSGTGFDYATLAYNAATGTQLWLARYNGPGNEADDANAMGIAPDGARVYVTGQSDDGSGISRDYATVAYAATTGTKLGVALYDGPGGEDRAFALGVSPDAARVYVTGGSQRPGTNLDYATIAYDVAASLRWPGAPGGMR